MNNQKMLVKQTRLEPFGIPICILMGTPEQINKFVARKFGLTKSNLKTPGFGGGVALLEYPKVDTPTILMAFPPDPELEAIAHEAVHALFIIQRIHGVEIVQAAEEWMAYTLGYIVRTVIDAKDWKELNP